MIELHIIQPDHQIIKAQLQDGLYYAGSSSSECQLPLKFPGVSRKHLEMRVKNSVLYIKDLDSANGTLLNNVALTPNNIVQVPPNGEMQLGSIRIKINSPAAAPAPYTPYSVNGVKAVSLAPGRSMELLHDTRPSNETRAYMHDTKARIAYGLGFDPCLVYYVNELGSAGARYSLQRNRRTLAAMRVQLEEMAAWQYRHIIAAEVAAGRLRPCRAANWTACNWVPLSDLTIDKGRDTTATINLVREGLADADRWTLATDGLPVEAILARRARTIATAKKLAEQHDIPLSLLLSGALGATTPTQEPPPAQVPAQVPAHTDTRQGV